LLGHVSNLFGILFAYVKAATAAKAGTDKPPVGWVREKRAMIVALPHQVKQNRPANTYIQRKKLSKNNRL
jgi:hypothetical protein